MNSKPSRTTDTKPDAASRPRRQTAAAGTITSSKLIRWAGLPAILAGVLFIMIQTVHPPDTLSSVTTGTWAAVHYLTISMALCGLLGVTGIYARQANKAGWLGLAGYLLISLFWAATMSFTFVEAFILPLLAADNPEFVEGFLGIFSGAGDTGTNLGTLPMAAPLAGGLYIIGGLLFGVAAFRSGVLPRWAAGLVAFGAVSTVASSLLHHPLDRLLAVPMGLGLAGLGYALWSERSGKATA